MKFKDVVVNREEKSSVGVEEDSGKHYVSIPVSNGMVDYEEYYEIDQPTFERYRTDPTSALEFAIGPEPAATIRAILGEPMSDPARVAAIEEGLASSDPEDVYDAIIDIDWGLLARVLSRAGHAVSPGVAERAARKQ